MAEIITLTSECGESVAKISTQGATVISWEVEGNERLFLSKQAVLDKPLKAIRGGIPVVFPNFGPWELGPQHGFARQQLWKVTKKSDRSATFELVENEYSLQMWPFKFSLIYFR